MQQPPPTSKRPGKRRGLVIIGLAAAGFLGLTTLPAILSTTNTGTTRAPATTETTEPPSARALDLEPTTTELDGSTVLACEHFRNVMGDVAAGLLSDAELREKTKQFYGTGQRSGSPQVRTASRQMLAAITAGDTDAYLAAAKRMGAACEKVGQ
jgi:hypothetical protein